MCISTRQTLQLNRASGMTLVELVMAIALAGLMVAGLMAAYSSLAVHSADPMIRIQTVAVAESLLEEALLKPFLDPSLLNSPDPDPCPASPGGDRDGFNNVCDYAGYKSNGIRLPNGTVIDGLENYSVEITVETEDDLGASPATVPVDCALKVTVAVTSPLNEITVLTGYRTNYETTAACI